MTPARAVLDGRLFLAVPLPDDVRAALTAHLSAALGRRGLPGRPVAPANWHLTLRFLGDTDAAAGARLDDALSTADPGPPFTLRLGACGAFPNPRKARVLWIGVGGDAARLETLAAHAERAAVAAGFRPERRPFRPHLTLARLRPQADVHGALARIPHLGAPLPVRAIVLYRSHLAPGGPTYEPLVRYPLS